MPDSMTSPPYALDDFRRRKDAYFASGRGPIRGEALETFTGLSYYPANPALVFRLPVERSAGEEVTLQTSSGEPRQMQAFGTVQVTFGESEVQLTLYAQPGEEAPSTLFLPFRDAGSGSYGLRLNPALSAGLIRSARAGAVRVSRYGRAGDAFPTVRELSGIRISQLRCGSLPRRRDV